ncbi:MAG: tetratricopeptide repeat protein [Chitinophagaceae bacterium]|nr:tetratricopeptide repeat protein [Chitinophagaceae bacterium]
MQNKLTRLPYIICYICAFVVGMKQLREPDMWWQLLTGRWMLEHGEVTHTDMFSYTMEGTKWVNVKWLYEVLAAFLEKGLGPHGVMLLQAIMNVAIVYLLLKLLVNISKHMGQQVSTLFSTTAVLLFLAISEFRMAGRPEMISHLMAALYLFILWQSKDLSWKRIGWLVPLQCLWANMHEGYPVGMAIIGLYAAGGFIAHLLDKNKGYLQQAIRLTLLGVAMAAVILINPNFTELWLHSLEIFRQLSANKYTTELFSISQPEYWTIQGKAHITMLAIVCLFWTARIMQSRKGKYPLVFSPLLVGYLLSIPVMGYLSMTANRNIPFAQIVLMPSVAIMLVWVVKMRKLDTEDFYIKAAKRTLLVSAALGVLFYISIVSNKYYKFTKSPNRYGIHLNTLHNPTSAADFIKAYKLKGPAFSDYFVSSYLLWDLYPQFKSYIDLRDLDIFPAKFFDDYFKLYTRPTGFYELDSTYKFNYVVLSTSQLTTLQQLLYWQEGFNVVHIDPVCLVLLRDTEENEPINHGPAAQRLFDWPQEAIDPGWAVALNTLFNPAVSYEKENEKYAPLYAGRFYNMVQNYRLTLKMMRAPIITDFAEDPEALGIVGQSMLGDAEFSESPQEKQLKRDSARMYFERVLEYDDENMGAYLGLASLAISKGDFADAMDNLDDYLILDKTNDFAYFMYGICARNLWHKTGDKALLEDAIASFEQAINLNDQNDKSYLYLAEVYMAAGHKDKARESIQHTLKNDIRWTPQERTLLDTLISRTGVERIQSPIDMINPVDDHAGHDHGH